MICKKVYGRILHALILKYLIAIYVVRCNRIYSLFFFFFKLIEYIPWLRFHFLYLNAVLNISLNLYELDKLSILLEYWKLPYCSNNLEKTSIFNESVNLKNLSTY